MGSVESRVVDEEEAEPYQNDETSETEVTLKISNELMTQLQKGDQVPKQKAEPKPEAEEKQPEPSPEPVVVVAVENEEKEVEETKRVQHLIDELNNRQFRAPVSVVKCSDEREACLKCYRDNAQDALKCEQVSQAFTKCARAEIDTFVKREA